jgi:DNA-binding LacI/PurR family transcriptional regulator
MEYTNGGVAMATLSDVAKEANVSKMTVSRVINHPEQVTEDLRLLVINAMKTLNYRPNSAAKALAQNRTNVVKFLILEDIDTTEPYYMNLLFGIARGLDKQQYALQLISDRDKLNAPAMPTVT